MTETWAWAALAGLGAFHGLNPAMGWLFAVGLGLQQRSRARVLWALLPIALGHAASIAAVVAAVALLSDRVDIDALRWAAALILIAFGAYRLYGRHRPRRAGMQVGFGELALWSFLMATGHGAGLMLLPVLLHMPAGAGHAAHANDMAAGPLAVAVHTAAMLATTGLIAIAVYEWVGLAFLRRGWINLDLVWAVALLAAGAALLVPLVA